MTTDLELAYNTLTAKARIYDRLYNYYDGNQPLVYANERLREIFAGEQVRFTENWCRVVVDSVKDRIDLGGFTVPDQVVNPLDVIWESNNLNLESDTLHEAVLVTGEGFVIVWQDAGGQVEVFAQDPRLCHVFYQAENPRQVRFAAKLWVDNDKRYRMTLYYPDRLEYYATDVKAETVSSAAAFRPDVTQYPEGFAPNPTEQVPVFRFSLSDRVIRSELDDVTPLQNGINKLLTDMMVAAEYGAFRQRWVISNADPGQLKNSPNEIWSIPAGDGIGQAASVGDFQPTALDNYLQAVNQLAGDIARITNTPKHYFYGQGGDPSGEALIALEAPLNRKVYNRIKRLEGSWKQVISFALKLAGATVGLAEIEPVWKSVETVQPKTQADIRFVNVQAGIPIETQLRDEGWSEDKIAQMQQDRASLGDSLLNGFEKGQA